MGNDVELTLGERVHLASKDLKNILKPSIIAAIVGLAIIGIIGIFTLLASNNINEYSYTVYRINSSTGPLCDPSNFMTVSDSDPAKIVVIERQGADTAGILTGDIVTKINGIQIANAGEFKKWQSMSTNIKPGDMVNVSALRGIQQLSFQVQSSISTTNSHVISLGLVISTQCNPYYEIKEEKKPFAGELLTRVGGSLDNIQETLAIFATIFSFFLILTLWKGKKLSKEVNEWENTYLAQNYVLIFETTNPTGTTNGEKIFNMAQKIFPELRQKSGKEERWNGVVIGKNRYELDCFQMTNESKSRLFVAKYFTEVVDLEKLQELCLFIKETKETRSLNRTRIFRIICVARNYTQDLLGDSREEILGKIPSEYPLDLIIEQNGNYSVLRSATN